MNLNGGVLAVNSAGALGTAGTITFGGGTLRYQSSGTTDYSARFANTAGQEYRIDVVSGHSITFATARGTNTSTLVKSGDGILTLTPSSGNNNYGGGITLSGGYLQLGNAGAIGANNAIGTISFSGGGLRATAANTIDFSARFSTTAGQQYNIDTNGQNVTWGSALTSSGGTLTKNGAGILTLGGANTFTGQTTVNGGTLRLNHANAFSSGAPLALNGGIFDLNNFNASVGTLSGTSNITLGSGNLNSTSNANSSYSGNITGSGAFTKAGSGNLTLGGTNSYSGGTTISGGTLTGNSSSLQGNILNNAALVFNQASNGTYAGNITGIGSFSKDGTGTLTLTGNNTYSGVTNVNAGTLWFNSSTALSSNTTLNVANGASVIFFNNTLPSGSIRFNGNYTGNLTVGAGSTWRGNNTISGNLEVYGTLSPGNSPGTQTVDGNTFFFGGGSYNWEIADANGDAGVGYDTLVTGGTLNLGNLSPSSQFTINVISLSSISPDVFGPASGFDPAGSFSWTLATAGTISGFNANHFIINTSGFQNSFSGSFSLGVINNGSNQELVLSYIPEPSAFAALAGVAALGLAATRRRRRA